jgi:hypothetical protein
MKMNNNEYRENLLTKLSTLIGVLEIAMEKIQDSLTLPGANEERLGGILSNLENTMEICKRAQKTLMSSRPKQTPSTSGVRAYTEMSSVEEYKKFQDLPPITAEDVAGVDLMELCDKLRGD